MGTEDKLEIPVDNPITLFDNHLNDPQNERIIFSGIFGIGKSYFLKKFFETKVDEYLAVTLAPVNYSISNNEDIFRLIKYDILYELIITHKLELETTAISRHVAYGTILATKADNILEGLLSVAPLLNKSLGRGNELPNPAPLLKFLKDLIPHIESIEKDRKDANLHQRVLSYIKEIEQSILFESDFITEYITDSLERLASKNGNQKVKVLIIDDLDRIDPEHIFRLFNIFSSHFSYSKSTGNKFRFDKVIFVCDIENIRNIFSTKFGTNTDFSGYIDKFFSTEIFYFDNCEEVANLTNKIVSSINFGRHTNFITQSLITDKEFGVFNFLLKYLIQSGSLNMRRIKAIYEGNYNFIERRFTIRGSTSSIENWSVPAIIALEILVWIYGDTPSLEKALAKAALFENSRGDNNLSIDQKVRLAGSFITIVDAPNHNFKINSNANAYNFNFEGKSLAYSLIRISRNELFYMDISSNDSNASTAVSNGMFKIIISALEVLKASGYFKR